MKIFFWIIAIFILFLIQQGVLIPLGWSLLNPVLVFLVIFAIFGDLRELIILSVLTGVLFDFYSGMTDGIFVLTIPLITFLIHFSLIILLSREGNRVVILLSVIFASILFVILPLFFNWLLDFINLSKNYTQPNLLKNLLSTSIFNLLLFFPIYFYYKFFSSLSLKTFNNK